MGQHHTYTYPAPEPVAEIHQANTSIAICEQACERMFDQHQANARLECEFAADKGVHNKITN